MRAGNKALHVLCCCAVICREAALNGHLRYFHETVVKTSTGPNRLTVQCTVMCISFKHVECERVRRAITLGCGRGGSQSQA